MRTATAARAQRTLRSPSSGTADPLPTRIKSLTLAVTDDEFDRCLHRAMPSQNFHRAINRPAPPRDSPVTAARHHEANAPSAVLHPSQEQGANFHAD